jgi:TolA-binding protein
LLSAYPKFYPQDLYLPYWLGLAFQGQGEHQQAAAEFSRARLDGPTAWRLSWRRAQTAVSLGEHQQAREFCRMVLAQAPDFAPAEQLL